MTTNVHQHLFLFFMTNVGHEQTKNRSLTTKAMTNVVLVTLKYQQWWYSSPPTQCQCQSFPAPCLCWDGAILRYVSVSNIRPLITISYIKYEANCCGRILRAHVYIHFSIFVFPRGEKSMLWFFGESAGSLQLPGYPGLCWNSQLPRPNAGSRSLLPEAFLRGGSAWGVHAAQPDRSREAYKMWWDPGGKTRCRNV